MGEANHILVSVKTAFWYMDKDGYKIILANVQPEVVCTTYLVFPRNTKNYYSKSFAMEQVWYHYKHLYVMRREKDFQLPTLYEMKLRGDMIIISNLLTGHDEINIHQFKVKIKYRDSRP